jgi:tripartite ATP-independent transporter DctM subunit
MNALVMVGTFVMFLLLGTPIGYSLGLASFVYLVFLNPMPLMMVPQRLTASLDSFPLMAVPFFILAGNLMNTGGITDRLVQFAMRTVGHVRGGLAHTTVVTNMIMAGMSGSSVADCAGTGMVLIPAMKKEGYSGELAAGITASAATIGPIIPPSIPMVLYGVMAGASITRLFVGGFLPGVLMGLSLMALVYRMSDRWQVRAHPRATVREWFLALFHALLPLGLPAIIMGGIIFGIFTPTEAAAVAVVYSAALGLFIYRELGPASTLAVVKDSLLRTASVVFIFANAAVFSWLIAVERVPDLAGAWLLGVTQSPAMVLLILNVFLLIAGCLLDPTPILLITVPVIAPLIVKVGIDPVHFGVVMVLNLMIGLLTPPVGLNLYIVSNIAGISFWRAVRGTAPFIVPLLIVLAIITYFPQTVLWLPNLIVK